MSNPKTGSETGNFCKIRKFSIRNPTPCTSLVGKTSANLPTLCQCFANIFAKAVIIVVVSFLEFFHDCLMVFGHFLLLIGIQFAKNTFFYYDSANVGGILAQHWLPTSALCILTNTGQCWMPAAGQHCWIKFFLTTDNFLLLI